MSILPLVDYHPLFPCTTPFQWRVENIVRRIEMSQLISQAHLNHFISKFRTTKTDDYQNQTWHLCYLYCDVLLETLSLTDDSQSLNQLISFCDEVVPLLEAINPPGESIDDIFSRYREMKEENAIISRYQHLFISTYMNAIGVQLEIAANQAQATKRFRSHLKVLLPHLSAEKQAKIKEKYEGDLIEAAELTQRIHEHVISLHDRIHREMPLEE